MENLQEHAGHLEKHRALIESFEQMAVLVNQLATGEYRSLDLYINNCRHFRDRSLEVQAVLADKRFETYLMRNDITLYYSIHSVNMAFGMMTNMLENLKGFLS
ncbi:hypothetical protein J1781_20985 [Rahnella sp. C60]|jgi:DNA topoisomerase VI subunit A|uniref:Uncharacterized protein n=1 Tax=Rahnella perminowiae TaxID=2816244 RepID=A0ABS6L216_9GAMM|nr:MULTISPECIES: hypothetical protein [Rahnella]UJD87450.1 hypothetical protein FS594_00825 [Rahnella aquatilis]MBU9817305.1 hypothetical protein [Rahnella perminowiae]MBU9824057.1 hypothetical protein [Rahnella perminowiae]MBU9835751.1 hypothetical protein [Rahnella perminowiae]MCR8999106.1 hypothetical protein [Rahnella perminowiae]